MFLHSGASLHNCRFQAPDFPIQAIPSSPSSSPVLSHPGTRKPLPMFRFNMPYPSEAPVAVIPEETTESTPSSSPTITSRKRAHRRSLLEPSVSSAPSSPTKRSLGPRPVSDYIPRNGHVVRFQEPDPVKMDKMDALSIPDDEDYHIPNYFTQSAPASGTNSILQSGEDDTHSEFSDNSSTLTASIAGASAASRRRSKRLSKTGSKFIIAQPPPKVLKKSRRLIQIRPQLLLQIQLVTETRPMPVFDVLPSSFLTGSPIAAPRLARKFPRLFRASGSLGTNDLVLARSEDYGIDENGTEAEERLDRRELIAVFSPVPETGNTDIVLADGTVWTASALPNGSWDFIHETVDGVVTHARWAKRRISTGSVSEIPRNEEMPYKYTFSILDPTTRRHPVMATTTQSYLEVQDFCFLPEQPHESTSPTPRSSVMQKDPDSLLLNIDRRFFPIDTETRAFIAISSVWVSLQAKGISTAASPSRRTSVRRSLGPLDKPQSPAPSTASTIISHSHSQQLQTSALSNTAAMKRCSLPALSSEPTIAPRRSMSTGAAFIHRRVTEAAAAEAVGGGQLTQEDISIGRGLGDVRAALPASLTGASIAAGKEKKGLFSSLKRAFSRRNKTPRQ